MPLPKFVTPKEFIKNMLKHPLLLDGQYVEGKPLDIVVDEQFNAAFSEATKASIQQILIELNEEETK